MKNFSIRLLHCCLLPSPKEMTRGPAVLPICSETVEELQAGSPTPAQGYLLLCEGALALPWQGTCRPCSQQQHIFLLGSSVSCHPPAPPALPTRVQAVWCWLLLPSSSPFLYLAITSWVALK